MGQPFVIFNARDFTVLADAPAASASRARLTNFASDHSLFSAAEEVALADVDAIVAQDGVRGGDMEKHVRDRPTLHEF
jgi:hypothetical protein